jgi:hypothetical protein
VVTFVYHVILVVLVVLEGLTVIVQVVIQLVHFVTTHIFQAIYKIALQFAKSDII